MTLWNCARAFNLSKASVAWVSRFRFLFEHFFVGQRKFWFLKGATAQCSHIDSELLTVNNGITTITLFLYTHKNIIIIVWFCFCFFFLKAQLVLFRRESSSSASSSSFFFDIRGVRSFRQGFSIRFERESASRGIRVLRPCAARLTALLGKFVTTWKSYTSSSLKNTSSSFLKKKR